MICIDSSNVPSLVKKESLPDLKRVGELEIKDRKLIILSDIDSHTKFDSYIDFQSLPPPLNAYVLPCPSYMEWEDASQTIDVKEWESLLMSLRSSHKQRNESMTLLPTVCNHTTDDDEEEEEEEEEEDAEDEDREEQYEEYDEEECEEEGAEEEDEKEDYFLNKNEPEE